MGKLADLLDALTVKTKSPDGLIEAVYSQRSSVKFSFEEDAYEGYATADLEFQLGSLLTSLWGGVRQGQARAFTEITGKAVQLDPNSWDSRRRRFRADRDELTVYGVSARGFISIHSIGLKEWDVGIDDDATVDLGKDQFLSECTTAFTELLRHHISETSKLREQHYGGRKKRGNRPHHRNRVSN